MENSILPCISKAGPLPSRPRPAQGIG